jgi:tetratricopeptide (TPR) repeat protein
MPAGVRPIKAGEAAKLAEAYDPLSTRPTSRLAGQEIPPERLEALGDLAMQNRNYDQSLVSFLQILKDQPENYELRYKVGVIFLLSGQWEAARRELARVLLKQPDMLAAHEALGLVHLQEKQYPLALEEFRQVSALEPNRARTRYLMGVTHLMAGQNREAISVLTAAAALDPRHVPTLTALGQACFQVKDYNQAISWLKKGQSLAPEQRKLNYHLGMALAAVKRYPEALQAFLKTGDEAQAYNNIGVHYFMEGQYEEAAKCFQRALELRPTFYQEARVNLNRALERLRQAKQDAI